MMGMRRRRGYRAAIHCSVHHVDLEALCRFVSDGRPRGDEATLAALRRGECPACQPRYLAGWSNQLPQAWDSTKCDCCGTDWTIVGDSWVASAGPGLQMGNDQPRIPQRATIAAIDFVIEPFDPERGPREAIEEEFRRIDAFSGVPPVDDLVEDMSESMIAAWKGEADLEAELGRISAEHHLSPAQEALWSSAGREAYVVVSNLVEPEGPVIACSRCGDPAAGVEVSRERFQQMVTDALDSIPPDLARHMQNVAVVVGDENTSDLGGHLGGLYRGVDLTRRRWYAGVVPDQITIYQKTLSKHCNTEADLERQVRHVVIHEVAHHFGFSDPELTALGWG